MDREYPLDDSSAAPVQRHPSYAFFMSLLIAGWGLFYLGERGFAARVVALLYGGLLVAGLLGLLGSPPGFYALVVFVLAIKFGSALLAERLARQPVAASRLPSKRAHWLYVLGLMAVTATLFYPLRASVLGYQLYYIPSGSMAPTLWVGDYIISDTHYDQPQVGDIVVYRYQGIVATKRVAAVGGETLAIVNGEVLNNGRNLGLFHAPADRVQQKRYLNMAPVTVAAGHVFLLGDNRDASNDSRFIGQVPVADVLGKVTGIWYSTTAGKTATTFD